MSKGPETGLSVSRRCDCDGRLSLEHLVREECFLVVDQLAPYLQLIQLLLESVAVLKFQAVLDATRVKSNSVPTGQLVTRLFGGLSYSNSGGGSGKGTDCVLPVVASGRKDFDMRLIGGQY